MNLEKKNELIKNIEDLYNYIQHSDSLNLEGEEKEYDDRIINYSIEACMHDLENLKRIV